MKWLKPVFEFVACAAMAVGLAYGMVHAWDREMNQQERIASCMQEQSACEFARCQAKEFKEPIAPECAHHVEPKERHVAP